MVYTQIYANVRDLFSSYFIHSSKGKICRISCSLYAKVIYFKMDYQLFSKFYLSSNRHNFIITHRNYYFLLTLRYAGFNTRNRQNPSTQHNEKVNKSILFSSLALSTAPSPCKQAFVFLSHWITGAQWKQHSITGRKCSHCGGYSYLGKSQSCKQNT